jgi:type II secretion system protein D
MNLPLNPPEKRTGAHQPDSLVEMPHLILGDSPAQPGWYSSGKRPIWARVRQLTCISVLAAVLVWRTPTEIEAQTAPKAQDQTDKSKAATTNSPPKTDAATAQKPAATADAGKDPASSDKEKSAEQKTDDPSKPKDDKSSDEILVSFQGANIDMIVQWLAQTSGKNVLKHPRVQCQLTIVGSKKVTKREALNLVYRALALEGFNTIESSKSILIVPADQDPKLSPELIGPARTDIPEGRQRLIKIFPLKHVQAADIKDKVRSVLTEKATVDSDDRANQLIITDYNENIVQVADMIAALDSDKPQDVSLRVIPLKNVSAQDLVKEVSPLYQKMSGKGAKEAVEITANDRSNSLIILSSESTFRTLEKIVALLDTEEAQEKVMRAFPLKNAEAADVAKQLQDLYTEQEASMRYPFYSFSQSSQNRNTKKMNVVADRRRNTVIVQAAPSSMDNIAKMIGALDEPVGDETLAPKIYPLKYVSAGDLEDILNELFLKKTPQRTYWYWDEAPPAQADRDVGRLYGKVRITSEPHSNSLIITANSAENLEAIEAVIKQLDAPSEAGDTTLRVGLNFAKAATVANNVNILFAKNGSPPLRAGPQPGQQPNQNQLQQQQNQNNSAPNQFELEQDAREEGYFPWLNGQPDIQRGSDRATVRPVSDLVGRVRIVPDHLSNALLISANVHFFPQVLRLIEELDVPAPQVLIEARIVEVASDFLDKLGIRWSPDGSKVFTADDFDNSVLLNVKGAYAKGFGAAAGNLGGPAAALANSLHSGVISSTMNLDYLIQFLKRTTDATVLAEPQINIKDNEVGRLFVGQQVPFIDRSLSTDVGGLNQSFSYKNVGVILEVTPHINSSGDVSLRVRAESSAIVPGQTLFGGAILDTRNFKTDLTAKDGETLVLGGIIQKQISDTERKTPILGDIPGLKWFFNKKDKSSREVELMVFLRPKIIRSAEAARELLEDVERKAPLIKQWQEDAHPQKPESKPKP